MDGMDIETGEVADVPMSGPYRWSQPCDKLFAALAEAQSELENVEKDGSNPAFRSKYAKLGNVLDEVRPKFAKHGIAITQMPINGAGANIGIVTLLAHKSGQWLESTLYVAPTKFDAQGAGSVITYLRRYALMSIAGVGPEEDDDGNAAVGRPSENASAARTAQGSARATLGSLTRSPATTAPSDAKSDATRRWKEIAAAIRSSKTAVEAEAWANCPAWEAMEKAVRGVENKAAADQAIQGLRDIISQTAQGLNMEDYANA